MKTLQEIAVHESNRWNELTGRESRFQFNYWLNRAVLNDLLTNG